MNTNNYILLTAALFSLLVGLLLYWLSTRGAQSHFFATNLIAWLLIALFPVFLIFAFFPNSSFSGTILGVSLGGALGAFIFIWMYGTKKTREAIGADDLVAKNQALQEELAQLKARPQGDGQARVPKPLREWTTYSYSLKKVQNKKIGLMTGNIMGVKGVDIWVSSENTNMEMARFYDRSVSATIRYLGSKRDDQGDLLEDLIAIELAKAKGNKLTVPPATVLVTGAGELSKNNVKKIFHVAAVQGQAGVGYVPINNIDACITNALQKADELSAQGYKSIIFPLLGTGTARANMKETAEGLISTAISYLESNQNSTIEGAYFLTWSDAELERCQEILAGLKDRVTPI